MLQIGVTFINKRLRQRVGGEQQLNLVTVGKAGQPLLDFFCQRLDIQRMIVEMRDTDYLKITIKVRKLPYLSTSRQ